MSSYSDLADEPGRGDARRPRKQARAAILDAAETLLLERGAEGVSIRALSQACGYSAPTIYHHFGDKTGLIDAVLEARFSEALDALRRVPRGPEPGAHLRELARAYVSFALAHPNHYRLLSVARPGSEEPPPSAEAARALVRQSLDALVRDGSLATSDVDVAFQVIWAVLHGLISLRIDRSDDFPLSEDVMQVAFDMVDRGLLRPGGVER